MEANHPEKERRICSPGWKHISAPFYSSSSWPVGHIHQTESLKKPKVILSVCAWNHTFTALKTDIKIGSNKCIILVILFPEEESYPINTIALQFPGSILPLTAALFNIS